MTTTEVKADAAVAESGKPALSKDTGQTGGDLIDQLVAQARAQGLDLTGEGGLLQQLTKRVLESALEGEITDHLGYDKHDPAGKDSANSRNGRRSKTVTTDIGPVEIDVPRDRDGSFDPQIVRKRQRRLTGVDEMVLSLSAKGLTHGEISAHLAEVYGANVSKQTISTITDKVIDGMTEWQNRPLDAVYPVIFLDAIHVKIRDGQVANRPIYVALAVTVDGTRDILGLWAGDGGEDHCWLQVLTELKNRGVADACMVVCDGLTRLPDAVAHILQPQALSADLHRSPAAELVPVRGPPGLGQDRQGVAAVYTAATESAAMERWLEFAESWGTKYPAIVRLWENAWAEFVPFLQFDPEIRKVVCSTNAIESVNAQIRRAVKARGHFPNEQAALKCVYLAVISLDPTGKGRKRWIIRWKAALNAFEITFEGRPAAARN